MYRVSVCTNVLAPQASVWNYVSTMKGVNYELYPVLQMTCPDMSMRISKELVKTNTVPLFRSWLLLFCIVPVDFDDINITEVVEGKSFSERSLMALMTQWHHDRTLETSDDGTIIVDELAFTPRVRVLGCLLNLIVRFLFCHRHQRLQQCFGCSKKTTCRSTFY